MNVGFSADGKQFLTSGETIDGWDTVSWQKTSTRPIKTLHGPAQVAGTRGSSLVLSGFDGTLTVWDPDGFPTIARVLEGSPPTGGTFSPDGRWLAITTTDDTIALYRTPKLELVRRFSIRGAGPRGVLDGPTPAAFSSDSRVMAIGDRTGDVQLFDMSSQRELGPPIRADRTSLTALAFNPDGRSLVTTSNSNNVNGVHVVDVASRRVTGLDPPVPYALAATFRPDGKELVVTVGVGGAARYPVADGAIGRGATANLAGAIPETAAFSPDGKLLAIGRTDGTLSFLDTTTGEQLGSSVPIASGLLAFVSWSNDGRLVVVQDVTADNSLVDVGQRARIGGPGPGAGTGVFGIAGFAPDGKSMVLPGPRGTTIWNLDVADWPAKACTIAGRDLTRVEWNTYFSSSGAYRSTCAP